MTISQKLYFIYDKLQLIDNLGLIARALKNCNHHNIRLVAPKFEQPYVKAKTNSRGADDLIENLEVFENFDLAIADLTHLYVTSKRTRNIQNLLLSASEAAVEISSLLTKKSNVDDKIKIGIAFGCEASGLNNSQVAKGDKQIYFDLNSEFSSLNISHATAILAYLINISDARQLTSSSDIKQDKAIDYANKEQVAHLVNKLITALEKKNYFKNSQLKPSMTLNLINLVYRNKLSKNEVQSLENVVNFLTLK